MALYKLFLLVFCCIFVKGVALQENLETILSELFSEPQASIFIDKQGNVTVNNLSETTRFRSALKTYIRQRYPQLKTVVFKNDSSVVRKRVLFPSTELFRPIVSNPFEASNFIYIEKTNDPDLPRMAGNYSLGSRIPMIRFFDLFHKGSALQLDFEASNMGVVSSRMRSYSYVVGMPLTYAYGNWEARLRVYHYCGHNAESLINELKSKEQPIPETIAWESIDLTFSYQDPTFFRTFIGGGFIARRTYEGKMTGLIGFEKDFKWSYTPFLGYFSSSFISVNIDFWPWLDYKPSINSAVGVKYAKVVAVGRQYLLALRYHNGYGEGTFKFRRVNSFSIGYQILY